MAGRYHHLISHGRSSWGHRWRALRHGLLWPYRPDPTEVARIPRVPPRAPPAPPPGQAALTWVGHSTFLLQIPVDGRIVNVLTDPVWSDRVAGHIRRLHPPGIPWDELPPIDVVLLSHNHYD
ncbi:MAG: MBL fold metallo-hydrolase, partial [Thermoplasmatota archaeon]